MCSDADNESEFFFDDSSPRRGGIFDDLACTGDSFDGVEFKQSEHLLIINFVIFSHSASILNLANLPPWKFVSFIV
jgi:hypothetical protein